MADPLSTAASVAGLVSLALQVYSGVLAYLDAVQCRNDDLESTRQSAKDLEDTIRFIEQFIPQLQASHQMHAATISKCVQSCQIQLASLQKLLDKLEPSPTSSGPFWNKARDRGKKLTYPFHRSNLDRLESQLGKANGTLQTALQVLEIREQQATNTMLAGIESVTRDTPAELRRLSSDVAAAGSILRGVDNALPPMRNAVAALGPLLASKADETNTQLARMESSLTSSMLLHQALLTNAASVANQRNADYESKLNSLMDILTRRLVSAPSDLREFSDELTFNGIGTSSRDTREHQFQGLASPRVASRGCLCRARQHSQGGESKWGPLRFYSQALVEERHLPDCPRRRFFKTRSKRTYGVTYTGLVKIMNRALDMSYSMCFGAGGWSISREFRCISIVDHQRAPVFRLMMTLNDAMLFSTKDLYHGEINKWRMTVAERKYLLDSVLGKIKWLFENRLGFPDDVNAGNQTIMFWVMGVVFGAPAGPISSCQDGRDILNDLIRLLEVLQYYDVPMISYDNFGWSPIIHPMDALTQHPSWIAPIVHTIIAPMSETALFSSGRLKNTRCFRDPLFEMVSCFEASHEYAEGWGLGPLSLAIVAGDVGKVRTILERHPALLKEVNLLEQTPFHLAVGNPACLKLLLEALQPADHDLLDHGDARGDNVLAYAIASSLKQCRSNSTKLRCRRCTCASSLVMLLKSKACSLPLETILGDLFNTHASLRCKIKFTNHLKHRGESLRKLALDAPFWTKMDAELYNLRSTDVLDAYAIRVIHILEKHGVPIPNSFKSTYDGSVYHLIRAAADADQFYRRGFRDVAVPGKLGVMPLEIAFSPPSYISWLVEHGAPLTSVIPRATLGYSRCRNNGGDASVSQNRTHAHGIAFRMANFVTGYMAELQGGDLRKEETSVKLLSTVIAPAETADDCNCPCSGGGCTPWTDMIKGMCYDRGYYMQQVIQCYDTDRRQRVANSVSILAERFSSFLKTSHQFLDPTRLRAAIRFLTFSGLGMTHFCCWPCLRDLNARPDFHRLYTCDEIHEIRQLESTEVLILEELVTEFSEHLNLQSSSFIVPVDINALEKFWKQNWVPRVEEALGGLKGAADYETETKGAEEIGVIWEKPDIEVGLTGYTFWANKIDEIMDDARGLLKARIG